MAWHKPNIFQQEKRKEKRRRNGGRSKKEKERKKEGMQKKKKDYKYSSRNRRKFLTNGIRCFLQLWWIWYFHIICNYLLLLCNNKVEHFKKCFLALHVSSFFFRGCFPYLLPSFQLDYPFLICRNSIHSLDTKTWSVICIENISPSFCRFLFLYGVSYEEKNLKFSIFLLFFYCCQKLPQLSGLKQCLFLMLQFCRSEV